MWRWRLIRCGRPDYLLHAPSIESSLSRRLLQPFAWCRELSLSNGMGPVLPT